ncbi:YciI family protein [Actinotalea sp. K2]|uniref:YciI family protein n=1 Tax=Actinotalea sp. K2 TaxID=2939438 RepID=UPI002016C703|nr:YciI family protein [Actinotalea sp. K2]MCL3861118.1 YciI family protein [Actinotalea sp. K2]
MTYLMIVRVPEDAEPTPQDASPEAWFEDVTRRGVHLAGDRLRPPSDATCVRVRDGETVVTHGPFVEIAEQIAGFDLLQVADLEEAVGVAGAHPVARFGALELRELVPHDDDPAGGANAVLEGAATYLLLMGREPGSPTPAPQDAGSPVGWIQEMRGRDVDRGGSLLAPPDRTVTVRVRGGEVVLARGPFAQLPEQVDGYNLIDAADLDEALEVAAAHPAARHGVVEIRPMWPL